jgi:hypothetical protein
MIKLIFILLLITNIFSAIITGNQGKLSVAGGSMSVTAGGVTEVVNSGQITFIKDGQAPSKARKTNRNDLSDIMDDLKAKDGKKKKNITLKYALVSHKLAKKIRLSLIHKKFEREAIRIKRKGSLSQLWLVNVPFASIKTLYPPYYKAAKKFFTKKKNEGKRPTLSVKLSHMKRYHRTTFRKYGN